MAIHQNATQTALDKVIGSRGPALELDGYPRQGFAPLRVTFHAVLQGVAENDSHYKCTYEEWDFGDGRVSGEQSDCGEAQNVAAVLEYTNEHVFQHSGTYVIRFALGKDQVVSKRVSVIVWQQFP